MRLRKKSLCYLKSPWVFLLNSGSCNGCDIETIASFSARFDAERFGCQLVGSPRHADVLLITGPVTRHMVSTCLRVYEQIPMPKVVVVIGTCGTSGSPFLGSEEIAGPIDRFLPVDFYVPGCPPKPVTILKGILTAVNKEGSP